MKLQRKQTAENHIKKIRRKFRKIFSSDQKAQIDIEVLEVEKYIGGLILI